MAWTSFPQLHLGHTPISFDEVTGKGKASITFDRVPMSRRRRAMPPRTPTSRCGCMRCSSRGLSPKARCTVYETLERPLVMVLADMERAGITIDPDLLRRLSNDFAKDMAKLESEIHKLAGENFNIASPKQLGEILFDKFSLAGGRKTKTGAWSTDVDVLEDAGRAGPRNRRARCSTGAGWPSCAAPIPMRCPPISIPRPGRVHTSYAMAATSTGRLASTDPNLQNIPSAPRRAARIRQAFVARQGQEADQRRLQPDRAAPARPYRRYPAAQEGLRRRARHSCHDRVGNFRRAGQGHAPRSAPPRQGDQFRHRLRHFRLRARQPARHRARRGERLYQEIFRALSRHPRLYGRRPRHSRASTAMSRPCSAGASISARSIVQSRAFAAGPNARRSMRRSRARPPTSSAAP